MNRCEKPTRWGCGFGYLSLAEITSVAASSFQSLWALKRSYFMRGVPGQHETFDCHGQMYGAEEKSDVIQIPSMVEFKSSGESRVFYSALSGSFNFVRPSVGAWVVYGLGTENPGFITINPAGLGGAQIYGSAFLPIVSGHSVSHSHREAAEHFLLERADR